MVVVVAYLRHACLSRLQYPTLRLRLSAGLLGYRAFSTGWAPSD